MLLVIYSVAVAQELSGTGPLVCWMHLSIVLECTARLVSHCLMSCVVWNSRTGCKD